MSSVGYDGIDNGGTFVGSIAYNNAERGDPPQPGFDFDLDTLTRQ
jgi:hypothetical protein